ncbi:MAG: translocation/assembly module TamB domain-containing protein [Zymomonas mobilis]
MADQDNNSEKPNSDSNNVQNPDAAAQLQETETKANIEEAEESALSDNSLSPLRNLKSILGWGSVCLAGLALVVASLVVFLDTAVGHRIIVHYINKYTTESGLKVKLKRIDGSIYQAFRLIDVKAYDQHGRFLDMPSLFVEWHPLDYRYGIITIKTLHAPMVGLLRNPEMKPTKSDPNAPLLPNIHLDIDRIDLDRIDISKNLDGQNHRLHMHGRLALIRGQITVKANAGADKGQGISGGDTLSLQFDAKPAANLLVVDAHLNAPVGGVVDGLTHLGKPLIMDAAGKGNWQDWRGYIQAQSGDKKLLDWQLHNRNGAVHLAGAVYPAELLADQPASIQAFFKKGLQVDLTTHSNKNIVDIRSAVSGEMFQFTALGGIDWKTSRFNNMSVNLDIPNGRNFFLDDLSLKKFAFSSVLSGLIRSPTIDWRLNAGQIGWQGKMVENIQARGKMLIDDSRLSMPMGLSVGKITGLDPRLVNLLENLKVEGAINYGDHILRIDHSNISSRYIHANTTVITDFVSKKWRAAIKGGIDSYKVDGVGRLSLAIDSHLQPEKNGEFGMAGQMTLTGRDWQKPALKKAFGGEAVLRADVIANAVGGIRMPRFSLVSPEFHLDGNGAYQPKGNISLFVRGNSKTYGAMTLDVGGILTHPLIKANLLGVTINGNLAQTKNSLYMGQFELNGRGLDGVIRLTEDQANQAVNADITLEKARFTYGQAIDIESGRLRGKAVFSANPVFQGEALLNNIRYNNFSLKQTAGRVLYQKNQGEAGLTLQGNLPVGGTTPIPFNVALHSSFDENLVRANAQGNVAHLNWHMAAPVEIRSDKNGYDISKVVIQLPKGHIDLSGHYGGQNSYAAMQIADIDLSEANLLWPETNLSGQLSAIANADLTGNVPLISARLALNHFTRASITGLSQPVDLMMVATHDKNGLVSEAVIRQNQAMIGQMRLGITPNYAPEKQHKPDWIDALLKGRLSGGIRYNADADILWSMSGVSGQSIRGPLAVAADITGELDAPVLTGLIRGRSLRYENSAYDTLVSSIDIDGHFDQSKFFLDKMTGKAGKGTVSAKGYASLDAASDYDSTLNITLDKATLARADQMKSTVSGNLDIKSNAKEGGSIKGKLNLPETRYRFILDNKESVHDLSGVKRKGAVETAASNEATNSPPMLASAWKLDIRISAPEQLFVAGMGLESEWQADLRVRGTATSPNITGDMRVIRGTYTFAGRRFDIDHGEIQFTGGNPPNPALDITAEATVDDITATVKIGGFANRPEITFSSSPSLAQDEILSRLLFGSSVTSLSAVQAVQLAAALNTLRTGGKGFDPLDKLRSVIGIDRLRVVGANSSTGQGTSLAAGKYLFKNVYMEVITDTHGFTATQIRISLTRTLSLLSEASSFGSSNVSLRYSKDY